MLDGLSFSSLPLDPLGLWYLDGKLHWQLCIGLCAYSRGGGSGKGLPDEVAGHGQKTVSSHEPGAVRAHLGLYLLLVLCFPAPCLLSLLDRSVTQP